MRKPRSSLQEQQVRPALLVLVARQHQLPEEVQRRKESRAHHAAEGRAAGVLTVSGCCETPNGDGLYDHLNMAGSCGSHGTTPTGTNLSCTPLAETRRQLVAAAKKYSGSSGPHLPLSSDTCKPLYRVPAPEQNAPREYLYRLAAALARCLRQAFAALMRERQSENVIRASDATRQLHDVSNIV